MRITVRSPWPVKTEAVSVFLELSSKFGLGVVGFGRAEGMGSRVEGLRCLGFNANWVGGQPA